MTTRVSVSQDVLQFFMIFFSFQLWVKKKIFFCVLQYSMTKILLHFTSPKKLRCFFELSPISILLNYITALIYFWYQMIIQFFMNRKCTHKNIMSLNVFIIFLFFVLLFFSLFTISKSFTWINRRVLVENCLNKSRTLDFIIFLCSVIKVIQQFFSWKIVSRPSANKNENELREYMRLKRELFTFFSKKNHQYLRENELQMWLYWAFIVAR